MTSVGVRIAQRCKEGVLVSELDQPNIMICDVCEHGHDSHYRYWQGDGEDYVMICDVCDPVSEGSGPYGDNPYDLDLDEQVVAMLDLAHHEYEPQGGKKSCPCVCHTDDRDDHPGVPCLCQSNSELWIQPTQGD